MAACNSFFLCNVSVDEQRLESMFEEATEVEAQDAVLRDSDFDNAGSLVADRLAGQMPE